MMSRFANCEKLTLKNPCVLGEDHELLKQVFGRNYAVLLKVQKQQLRKLAFSVEPPMLVMEMTSNQLKDYLEEQGVAVKKKVSKSVLQSQAWELWKAELEAACFDSKESDEIVVC